MTHWKKLTNPDFLGAYALQPGEEPVLTIKEVTRKLVPDTNGKKEECTVVYFKESTKPMVLNVTNSKAIAKVAGSPYIEDWVGKKIKLYVDKVKAFGEDGVEALRVRPTAPKEKPVLDEQYQGWDKAKAAVQDGSATIEWLSERYILTPETIKKLKGEPDA